MLQIFQAQKIFPGAIGAQVASHNQVLTSMGWGVQSGVGGEEGGWCQASQVSAPRVCDLLAPPPQKKEVHVSADWRVHTKICDTFRGGAWQHSFEWPPSGLPILWALPREETERDMCERRAQKTHLFLKKFRCRLGLVSTRCVVFHFRCCIMKGSSWRLMPFQRAADCSWQSSFSPCLFLQNRVRAEKMALVFTHKCTDQLNARMGHKEHAIKMSRCTKGGGGGT